MGLVALISGFVVSGAVPLVERAFGVTTDIGLLEWADPSTPLLQRLLREAPGSYHHSMLVGTLAADAAEAIGANGLLARVCGYYHDVGKAVKPKYFVENLLPGEPNPHDGLSPTMSALIITAHARDGVDLALRYGLPAAIRDAVLQHHGTTHVHYFYGRALEQADDDDSVSLEAFRYRGPKPQTREIAIIQLADSVEAATRAMRDQPFARVKGKVQEVVSGKLRDEQLDESGISLAELRRIEHAFVRSVAAFFHSRIKYPGQEEEEEGEATQEELEGEESGRGAEA
jgi:putative nucleotidyltransferase with HDIG domain